MKKTLIRIVLWGGMSVLSAWGQTTMGLKDCMEYALQHSTKKAMQQADFDDALLQRREAILQAFTPTVSAGTNVYSNFGRTIDPETNSYMSSTSFSNGYSIQAGLTLFDGFAALNKIRMAQTAVRMGLSEEQKLKDEICLSVMQAYYTVIFQSEMSGVLQEQVETARENLKLMQRKYELGQKGYADVVQIEADLAEREYQLVRTGNRRSEALLNLKALMLWPVSDTLAVDSSWVQMVESSTMKPELQNHSDLAAFAVLHQPVAKLAQGRLENARHALHTARGQFLPTLSLNGGWSTSFYTYPGRSGYQTPSFASQFRNNGGEYVQLTLSFPLYDRLYRHSNLKRKKNDVRRAASDYQQTLHDIETEVKRALQDCRGAGASLNQAGKRLKAQEESYRLNVRKFAEGLLSPVEFQTLSNAFLNAKAEYTDALLQYRLKQSVVRFYQGESYLEQQTKE